MSGATPGSRSWRHKEMWSRALAPARDLSGRGGLPRPTARFSSPRRISSSRADRRPRTSAAYGQVTSGFQSANIPAGLCFQIQACLSQKPTAGTRMCIGIPSTLGAVGTPGGFVFGPRTTHSTATSLRPPSGADS